MSDKQRLSRVRNFIYSTPWCIMPAALEALVQIFENHICGGESMLIDAASKFHSIEGSLPSRDEYTNTNGIAVIRFVGPIMPRATVMNTSGATSLEQQMTKFQHALDNKDVRAIVLDFDTPGGSAMGLEEAALRIFEARSQQKPVVAIANSMMASAGYYLGCQADMCYATPAAMVGSIGVRMVLESDDRQRKNDGLDTEYSYVSGPLKGGVGPLTDAQRAELNKMGETFFSNFKSAVSRARPMLDIDKTSTGAVWLGKEAQQMGLVDGIMTMDQLIADLS